jgi:hypothetical protein
MTTVLELGLADLAGTRFAASPLSETVNAVLLLGHPGRAPGSTQSRRARCRSTWGRYTGPGY